LKTEDVTSEHVGGLYARNLKAQEGEYEVAEVAGERVSRSEGGYKED
jgi:hypothetical protein